MGKKKGRPPGAKNVTVVIDVDPIRCPKCDCNSREILNTRRVTGYIIRRCRCMQCGQIRLERERL